MVLETKCRSKPPRRQPNTNQLFFQQSLNMINILEKVKYVNKYFGKGEICQSIAFILCADLKFNLTLIYPIIPNYGLITYDFYHMLASTHKIDFQVNQRCIFKIKNIHKRKAEMSQLAVICILLRQNQYLLKSHNERFV